MTAKEKMTAPIASVGADVEQSSSNKLTNQSIADLPGKGNLQATNNAENTAKSANKKNLDVSILHKSLPSDFAMLYTLLDFPVPQFPDQLIVL